MVSIYYKDNTIGLSNRERRENPGRVDHISEDKLSGDHTACLLS